MTLGYAISDMVLGLKGQRSSLGLGYNMQQLQFGEGSNSMSAFCAEVYLACIDLVVRYRPAGLGHSP